MTQIIRSANFVATGISSTSLHSLEQNAQCSKINIDRFVIQNQNIQGFCGKLDPLEVILKELHDEDKEVDVI